MFGFKKKAKSLSVQDIFPIVYSFVKDNNSEAFELIKDADAEQQTNLLLGTPQWTLVQLIDNYLVCKNSPHAYQMFLNMEKSLGLEILPLQFSDSIDFTKKFFSFHVHIRPLSEDEMNKITEHAFREKTTNNQLDNFVRMIKHLQRQELEQNPYYEGTKEDEDLIDEQIGLNNKLVNHYLSFRPELV